MDIPKDKHHPADAVQCDLCGGNGCKECADKGWFPKGDPRGRTCYRDDCNNPIPPAHQAVYCTNECAAADA